MNVITPEVERIEQVHTPDNFYEITGITPFEHIFPEKFAVQSNADVNIAVIGSGAAAGKFVLDLLESNPNIRIDVYEAEDIVGGTIHKLKGSKDPEIAKNLLDIMRAFSDPRVNLFTGARIRMNEKDTGRFSVSELVEKGKYAGVFFAHGRHVDRKLLVNEKKVDITKFGNHFKMMDFIAKVKTHVDAGKRLAELDIPLASIGDIYLYGGGLTIVEDSASAIMAWQIDRALNAHNISIDQDSLMAKPLHALARLYEAQTEDGLHLRNLLGEGFDFLEDIDNRKAQVHSFEDRISRIIDELALKLDADIRHVYVIYRKEWGLLSLGGKTADAIKAQLHPLQKNSLFTLIEHREIDSVTTTGTSIIQGIGLVEQMYDEHGKAIGDPQPREIIENVGLIITGLGNNSEAVVVSTKRLKENAQVKDSLETIEQIDGVFYSLVGQSATTTNLLGVRKDAKEKVLHITNIINGEVAGPKMKQLTPALRNASIQFALDTYAQLGFDGDPVAGTHRATTPHRIKTRGWGTLEAVQKEAKPVANRFLIIGDGEALEVMMVDRISAEDLSNLLFGASLDALIKIRGYTGVISFAQEAWKLEEKELSGFMHTESLFRRVGGLLAHGFRLGDIEIGINENNGGRLVVSGATAVAIAAAKLLQAWQIDRVLKDHNIYVDSEQLMTNGANTLLDLRGELGLPDIDSVPVLLGKLGILPVLLVVAETLGDNSALSDETKMSIAEVQKTFFIEVHPETELMYADVDVQGEVRSAQLVRFFYNQKGERLGSSWDANPEIDKSERVPTSLIVNGRSVTRQPDQIRNRGLLPNTVTYQNGTMFISLEGIRSGMISTKHVLRQVVQMHKENSTGALHVDQLSLIDMLDLARYRRKIAFPDVFYQKEYLVDTVGQLRRSVRALREDHVKALIATQLNTKPDDILLRPYYIGTINRGSVVDKYRTSYEISVRLSDTEKKSSEFRAVGLRFLDTGDFEYINNEGAWVRIKSINQIREILSGAFEINLDRYDDDGIMFMQAWKKRLIVEVAQLGKAYIQMQVLNMGLFYHFPANQLELLLGQCTLTAEGNLFIRRVHNTTGRETWDLIQFDRTVRTLIRRIMKTAELGG